MVQLFSEISSDQNEYMNIKIDNPQLDFLEAKDIAKQTALKKTDNPMILSWKNGKSGQSYPDYECGENQKPFWIRFAESRGANLTIDINHGDYIFMILKI